MSRRWEIAESVDRCPTCGRFVEIDEGYCDLPPGGRQGYEHFASYCDEACAARKPAPCVYEDAELNQSQRWAGATR